MKRIGLILLAVVSLLTSCGIQNGCFTSSQNREENGWCQENEM